MSSKAFLPRTLSAALAVLLTTTCTGASRPTAAQPSAAFAADERFLELIRSTEFTGRFRVEGSFTLGPGTDSAVTLSVTGAGQFRGLESLETVTFQQGHTRITVESLTAGGGHFHRTEGGPWVRQPSSDLPALFGALTTLDSFGLEDRDGKEVYRFRPPPFFRLEPRHVGLDDPSVIEVRSAMVDLFAEPDGTPAGYSLDLTWLQLVGCAQVEVRLTSEYTITDIGGPVAISPPSEVWELQVSDRHGYRIAYPPGWDKDESREQDLFRDGASGAVVFVRTATVDAATVLEDLVAGEVQATGQPELNQPISVDDEPARILTFHLAQNGEQLFLLVAVVLHPQEVGGARRAYEIGWIGAPGDEQADRALFERFLTTLEFGC